MYRMDRSARIASLTSVNFERSNSPPRLETGRVPRCDWHPASEPASMSNLTHNVLYALLSSHPFPGGSIPNP